MISALSKAKTFYQSRRFTENAEVIQSRICVPYFSNKCLWTSASLNGGAVFEAFVKQLHDWTKKFAPTVTMNDIYSCLMQDIDNDEGIQGGGMHKFNSTSLVGYA